jgi:DNA polymerase-4
VATTATILHADLDSFYASVEQRDKPELRGKPVIVGGGVVVAASYEAKAHGVHAPMNGQQAMRICPEAIMMPPRMTAYAEASKDVFAVFEETSPTVEGISIDEAFLDVGGMEHFNGTPLEIAKQLRADVLEETGLKITVGVASTKFLAKVASGFAKPDGLLMIEPGTEIEFLHPLDIERLWGVGKVTSKKLRDRKVNTIGDLARLGEEGLTPIVGRGAAQHLNDLANNRDPRPVHTRGRRKSIGAQHALRSKPRTHAELDARLIALVDRICSRLRKSGRSTRTVQLSFRFADFTRATRSKTIPNPTSQSSILLETARELLNEMMPTIREKGITLLGVSFDNLDDGVQLELGFDAVNKEVTEIDKTVDAVREKFGSAAITRGVLIGQDEGLAAPVLDD